MRNDECMTNNILNFCPHPVVIYPYSIDDAKLIIPSDGLIRVQHKEKDVDDSMVIKRIGEIANDRKPFNLRAIIVSKITLEKIPKSVQGILVFAPDTEKGSLRNKEGKVIGVRQLIAFKGGIEIHVGCGSSIDDMKWEGAETFIYITSWSKHPRLRSVPLPMRIRYRLVKR